jgi:KDO2-lipid IV(A) lauroyltransferase
MNDVWRRPGQALGFIVGRSLLAALALLPRSAGRAFGAAAGTAFYHASGLHRRVALANLDRAFGAEWPAERRLAVARAAFRHLGRVIADAAYFPWILRQPTESVAVYEGIEHLKSAAAVGRGVLVFSGHYGHWELIALLQHRLGHPMDMVARTLDNPLFDRFLTRLREMAGNQVIPKRSAARGVLRALRAGRSVALLIDQNVRGDAGIFVDFFGTPASTTPALATLAFRSGAPILPVFSSPLPDGRLLIRYHPPIIAERRGALVDDIRDLTLRCTKVLEHEVRQAPQYWTWMHNRWKTRPVPGSIAEPRGPQSDDRAGSQSKPSSLESPSP